MKHQKKVTLVLRRMLVILGILLGLVLVVLVGLVHYTTLDHSQLLSQPVIKISEAPILARGQSIKVLSWNVQYMAGKDYIFWYDLRYNVGPHLRPTPQSIASTFEGMVELLQSEDPDVVLLQELDDGAARTDKQDQLTRLLQMLPGKYAYHTSAFYWKAAFIPHPKIMGSAGMKLTVLSKYVIGSATRHALADVPNNWLVRRLGIRRAVQQVRLPLQGGGVLAIVNTHLEAFTEGSDVMQRQVAMVDSLLRDLDAQGIPWIAGGDFNLLPPGQYARMPASETWYFNPQTEMESLYQKHSVLPTLAMVYGPDSLQYLTQFPNRPNAIGPDKTIDYLMHSRQLAVDSFAVLQKQGLMLSDHMPLRALFHVPR